MIQRASLVIVYAVAAAALSVSVLFAQTRSGIAGVVKDATGAALPGVTVEASSPALIEKVRTVVTDGQGRYNITDLRPGIYTVTFTLPGFNTVRREGLELSSTFTATVNAELPVGTLAESITVSGASPTVDIQNVVQQKVITREVLDVLPTGSKSWAAVAVLVPGVKVTGNQNVGGTNSSAVTATVHGSSSFESIILLDGMRFHQGQGYGGNRNAYNENDASVEEVSLETGALSAESEVGALVRNIVPKEGGNTFKFYFGTAYTDHNLQNNNLDDNLRARGVDSANYVHKIYDVNIGAGGPIIEDKLWFFTAIRKWIVDQGMAGIYFNKTPDGLAYTPDLSRQAISPSHKGSANLRLTWMATPKNKITVSYDVQPNKEQYSYGNGALGFGGIRSPESVNVYNTRPNYFAQAKWTNPVTSRLLLEAGTTFVNNDWHTDPQPDRPLDLPGMRELRTGTTWRNLPGTYGKNTSHQQNVIGNASYVTGSHAFKAGALYLYSDSRTDRDTTGNATVLQLLDGIPASVVISATPLQLDEKLGAQVGVFAQDQWTMNRATLNLGVRFDYYNASVPAQHLKPGYWVPTRDVRFDAVPNVPNWKDLSPRFGIAYDLFGTGKTAVKATLSKYLFGPEIITFTRLANPVGAIATTATRQWIDANNDFVPQASELGAYSAATFGTPRITTRYDPDLINGFGKRGDNWEVSAMIQHELLPRVGLSAAYFRRTWGNLMVTQNRALTSANYDEYCITAPPDSRLPGGGSYPICGLYDVTPTLFGATDNLITHAKNFGEQRDVYDGVDLSINARFSNGAFIAGGMNTERTKSNTCFAMDDPTLSPMTGEGRSAWANGTPRTEAFCDVRPPFLAQVKFYGAYPLPGGLQASATFQSSPGPPITASHTIRSNEVTWVGPVAPGRTLNGGTAPVQLVAPGTLYGDRLTQVDLRLSKSFTVRNQGRLLLAFDLYNLLNANTVIAQNNTFGPNWQRPTYIHLARLAKFAAQLTF